MTEGRDRSDRIESSSEDDPVERRLQPLYHIGIFVCVFGLGALSAILVMQAGLPDWFESETAGLIMFVVVMLMGAVGIAELLIRRLERRREQRASNQRV